MTLNSKWYFPLLMIITTILCFWRINANYVAFSDELLFEEASYNMAFPPTIKTTSPIPTKTFSINNYLIPVSHNQPWLEKPPLYFWITAPIYKTFNHITPIYPPNPKILPHGEFAYPWIKRFWTVIAGIATIAFTYKIAQITFKNHHISLLSGILLLSMPLYLSTTKSASLDLVATAFTTGSIYYYLKSILNPQTNKSKKIKIIIPILIGLAIMTRSFLSLTPLVLIAIHQKQNQNHRWTPAQIFKILAIILLIILPWHLFMYLHFPANFIKTYLGYNLWQHAIQLTPGYQPTNPFYYLAILNLGIPWILPLLFATSTYIIYYSRKHLYKPQNLSSPIFKLIIIWFAFPLIILSLMSTRHSWYITQILPPLAIILAWLTYHAYQSLKQCNTCKTTQYLAQISFLILTLSSIITVITVSDPSAPTIKALRWARQNLPSNQPLYSYHQDFLPHTILFKPHQTIVIQKLSTLPPGSSIFIATFELPQLQQDLPKLQLQKKFKFGNIYQLKKNNPS